jgi:O-antigen ligase
MAMSRPLTGVGLNNFADSFYGFGMLSSGHAIVSHSTWFGVLGETGVAGLAAFFAMVGFTLRDAIRSCARVNSANFRMGTLRETELVRTFAFALLAGLISFCVAGSFLTQGFTWPIYILVGLGTALTRYLREPYRNDVELFSKADEYRVR